MKEALSPLGRTTWSRSGLGVLGATYVLALVAYAGGLVALQNPPKDDAIPMRVSVKHGTAGSSGVIAAGANPGCAAANSSVQCGGTNGFGQIGNNPTVDSHMPVPVSGWAP